MPIGRVKWFNNVKKYGFIQTEEGKDIFVHFSEIMTEGYKTLRHGESVEFELEHTPRGEKAVHVRPVSREGHAHGSSGNDQNLKNG